MILLKNTCILFIFFISVRSSAQEKILNIWNGLAPGTENRQNNEYIEENKRVYNVFQPDLRVLLPSKRNSNRSAIIIFAGGGYRRIEIKKEGYKVAQWFNNHGISAFVLKYRLNPQEALQDAQRAVSYVRAHAQEYDINPSKIGVIGFSAGGHIVGNLVTHFERNEKKDNIDSIGCRPDFAIGVYGSYEPMGQNVFFTPFSQLVNKDTPPFFLVHAVNDSSVSYRQSLNLFEALQKAGVPSELHLFETGRHGFAFEEDRGVVKVWMKVLEGWLSVRNLIP